jgi:hypothetical protein
MGVPVEKIKQRVKELHEFNPMLGFRGCRLGIVYPEISEMQARAVFEAAAEVQNAVKLRSLADQIQRASEHSWINKQASRNHLVAHRLGCGNKPLLLGGKDDANGSAIWDALNPRTFPRGAIVQDSLELAMPGDPIQDRRFARSQVPSGDGWIEWRIRLHALRADAAQPCSGRIVCRTGLDFRNDRCRDYQLLGEAHQKLNPPNSGQQDQRGGVDDPAISHGPVPRPVPRLSPERAKRRSASIRG